MPVTIAVLGGTGAQGRGLAHRFAGAGHPVVLGSRSTARAEQAADELVERIPGASVQGARTDEAAKRGDVVVVAVPYRGHAEAMAEVAQHLVGKLVITCVNPLGFDRLGPYGLRIDTNSAAEELQAVAPEAVVVGAFHHLSAENLSGDVDLSHEDVLVCGDHRDAKARVLELVAATTGGRGLDAGPLRVARQLEPFTSVLINLNRVYGARSGVAVVGLDSQALDVGVPSAV